MFSSWRSCYRSILYFIWYSLYFYASSSFSNLLRSIKDLPLSMFFSLSRYSFILLFSSSSSSLSSMLRINLFSVNWTLTVASVCKVGCKVICYAVFKAGRSVGVSSLFCIATLFAACFLLLRTKNVAAAAQVNRSTNGTIIAAAIAPAYDPF